MDTDDDDGEQQHHHTLEPGHRMADVIHYHLVD